MDSGAIASSVLGDGWEAPISAQGPAVPGVEPVFPHVKHMFQLSYPFHCPGYFFLLFFPFHCSLFLCIMPVLRALHLGIIPGDAQETIEGVWD